MRRFGILQFFLIQRLGTEGKDCEGNEGDEGTWS